ncbi:chromodomain-helicase-DNA-binding protein 7 isoform X1 [Sergentomyia squamirostris]
MDGNAQNMFHGNHQGDAYYRYDATAPRPMGPPGAYARHRAPHPLQQQQQPQYPSYQTPTDSMYTMGDQHAGMGGMGDLSSAWGAPGQAGPYGTPTMGYGHPQTPQQQQRQPQPQPSYRQHMTGYPQDPQKMQFSTQQSMMAGMMPQQAYGAALGQPQQAQPQQRVPQHYSQTTGHPMYPGAPQPQPTPAQAYAGYGSGLQHQSSRSSHVGYGHSQLEQAAYGQHLQTSAAAGHHLSSASQQQAQQMPSGQNHQGHLTSQQMHPSQHVQPHPIGSQSHSQPHPQHGGLSSLPNVASLHAPQQQQQQQQQAPSVVSQPSNQPQQATQQQHMTPQPHPVMVHGQQSHPGMLHPGASANQHQPSQAQQPGIPPHTHSGTHPLQMGGHSLNAYGVPPPQQQQQQTQSLAAAQQQPSYLSATKQQTQPPQHSSGSPQYRAPFPQLSPQMSPRPPQISPHPQMSPRPVMSPAKPPPQSNSSSALSPHPQLSGVPSPRPGQQQSMPQNKNATPTGPVSTLQALEQMVMPPSAGALPVPSSVSIDYPPSSYRAQQHQQMPANPLSPMGPRMPMSPQQVQQQWPPMHRPGSASHMAQQQAQHLYPQQGLTPLGHVPSPQQQPQHSQILSDLSSSLAPVSQSLPPIPHPTSVPLQQSHYQQMQPHQQPLVTHQPPTTQHHQPLQQQQPPPQQQTHQSSLLQPEPTPQQPPPPVSNLLSVEEHLVGDKSHHQTDDLLMQSKQHQSTHLSLTPTPPAVSQIKIPDVLGTSQNSNSSTDLSGLIDPFSGVLEPMQPVSAVPVLPEPLPEPPQPELPRQEENTQDSTGHQEIQQHNQDSIGNESISAPNILNQVDEVNTELSRESTTCHSDDAATKEIAELDEVPKQQESLPSPVHRHSEDSSTQEGQPVRESQPQAQQDSQSDNSQTGILSSVTMVLENTEPIVTNEGPTFQQADTQSVEQNQQQQPSSTQPAVTQPLHTGPVLLPGQLGMPPQTTMYDHQMMMGRPGAPGIMAGGIMPHHGMPQPPMMPEISPYGPGPLMHHQEKAALQQQLQELYCMPPSPEQQEKIMRLQERLNMLQQHEANDQCNGGPTCILQSSMYSSAMIESPQVTSTTGRGRARGANKPRKPRQKKSEKLAAQAALNTSESSPADGSMLPSTISRQLPVSEDCVTPGAGLGDMTSSMTDVNDSEGEISQEQPFDELDTQTDDKGKKKKVRKPREPKPPKEPKLPKEPKERKKREPKDPNKPKKKRGRKSGNDSGELDLDSTVDNSMSLDTTSTDIKPSIVHSDDNNSLSNQILQNQDSSDTKEPKPILSDEVTDFDDIPVSKIPIKSLIEESNAKKLEDESNENSDSSKPADSEITPKKTKRNRSSGSRRYNRSNRKPAKSGGKRKSNRLVPESDGEGDDMISTPPPSPPPDSEAADSSKRRSARNTQRKKYVDDVMLRFSDEEGTITSPSTSGGRKEKKEKEAKDGAAGQEEGVSTTNAPEKREVEKPHEDFGGKPNYVYVNTTDEDSMVVQHVLAMRMGKRELKPEPPPPPPAPPEPATEPEVEKTEEEADGEKKPEVEGEKPEGETEETKMEIEVPKEEPKEEKPQEEEKEEKPEVKAEEEEKTPEKEEETPAEPDTVEAAVESAQEDEPEIEKKDEEPEKMEVDEAVPEEKPEEDKKEDEEKVEESKPDSPEKTDQDEEMKPEAEEAKVKSEDEVKTEENADEKKPEEKTEPVFVDVEEYFVKYRNFSYLHCEWRTEEELYKGDRRIASKIKRFHQKQSQQINIFENLEDEPYNPDFVEIDRILDVSEHTDANTGEKTKHYLIKWRSLPYEDSTWELEEDADQLKIEQYERFNKLPPKNEWKPKRRPHPDLWKKLEKTPMYKGNNSLRPYQLEGLNWLKFSWYNTHNCILADEMGLGKTIQSLTFIHSVYEYGVRGPFLVIAPLSTIPNWQREFEAWTDLNVIVYHGSVTSKQMLQEYEFYYKNDHGKVLKDFTKFNVLITTFEMIVTDYADLRVFNWRVCVIDEAHRLKNRNCKLLEGLRQLNLEHRVLLSGTPLQNNVSELFSLLNFLEPSQFASSDEFLSEFGSLKTEVEVEKLQALLKPMMLRRLKDDVEKSLAPKEETIVEVELTNIQKKYYRGILEQNFSFLTKGTTTANIPNLMNTMMELRKCCIHPYLLNGAEDQIQYEYKHTHGEDADAYYKNLIYSSGKMVLIDKLLPKLKANGHRVLIFSQMVRCLDILEDYLMYRKYPFERIDGRIRGDLRQAAIDRYCKPDSDRFVFLLCTKAGGLGINLTAADTVIIYDSDWNPQNDLQAQARCHRIGQQKMVKIYRLLCRNTYEREMFDKASMKLGLDKAILQSMNTSQGKDSNNKQLSKKEIEDLLKKGAYGAIMEEDAADKFCEEDIDSILQRRTQIITMEQEKGSTFSKASFAMSGNRSDINIDDPDFWKKWAKKADIDPVQERDEKEDLVMTEPRRRTQIKRYGHDESVMEMSDDSGTDTDEEGLGVGLRSKRRRDKRAKERARNLEKAANEDYMSKDRETMASLGIEDLGYGNWARSECFKVEKGLLTYGWGRWADILEHGQFKRGWREIEVEELARIILLYCLKCYKGDEKIKNFIWDLITPSEDGEEHKVSRNHSGLHNLVPRGRNAKGRKGKGGKDSAAREAKLQQAATAVVGGASTSTTANLTPATPSSSTASSSPSTPVNPVPITGGPPRDGDPNHWSTDDKYDTDVYLESSYRKHLSRHANKVLLRVRMLYYIKHEIIGDFVQQINDGVNISDLPIRPPLSSDQMPSSWWNPKCCDKSLLVGTYKHGCESYRQIRADPTLCFLSHCGPPEDGGFTAANLEDDTNSKHEEGDEADDDMTGGAKDDQRAPSATELKDNDLDRPSSSGIDDEEALIAATLASDDPHTWPTMQDLNTRLRRVITSYQRNYKKEEMKQQQKAKLQALVTPSPMSSTSTPTSMVGGISISPAVSTSVTTVASGSHQMPGTSVQASHQSQQHSHQQQQQQNPPMPTAADFSLMLSLGLGLNPADASQLANWDISKLAMYLQKMGHREKIEQQVREKERIRLESVQKKWNRREENEFLRVLTGYGIDLQPCTTIPTPDWTKFKSLAKLEKKSDESLSDYYKVFIAMCKRQASVKLLEDEKGLEGILDDISEDHARLILDRLELLSKLRELVKHPKLDERIYLAQNNYDTPDWWESGKHDRELVRAVLKHGLYRSEYNIFNDSEFCFYEAAKKYERELELQNQRALMKMEAELLNLERKESMKVEKPVESTLKIEKVPVKAENPEISPVEKPEAEIEDRKEQKDKEESPEEKEKPEEIAEVTEPPKDEEPKKEEDEKMEEDPVEKPAEEEKATEEEKAPEVVEEDKEIKEKDVEEKDDEQPQIKSPDVEEKPPASPEKEEVKETPEVPEEDVKEKEPVEIAEIKSPEKPVEKATPTPEIPEPSAVTTLPSREEKEISVEEECNKQAAELKARFPDLEVIQPVVKPRITDMFPKELLALREIKPIIPKLLSKQVLIRWFRDFALEKRISHIIHCVERSEWPVGRSYSAYTGCQGMDLDVPLYETVKRIPTAIDVNLAAAAAAVANVGMGGGRSNTPDVITITTDQGLSKQLQNPNLASLNPSNLGGSAAALSQSMAAAAAAAVAASNKKRKRHIAIDVETERAKLHALLNNTQNPAAVQKSSWAEDESSDSRRGSSSMSLQPPPAHQHTPLSRPTMSYNKPTVIPGTSSTLTPIDLSSSLPKVNMADMIKNPIDLSEVQDFSMSKNKSSGSSSMSSIYGSSSSAGGKGKLDNMLTKLMKKNNCQPVQMEEPIIGKEKKRRKLDEIVLGLSAAQEQKMYPDPSPPMPMKKPQVAPSVSVTPASGPSQSASSSANQKPFTITVTSVPAASNKAQSMKNPPVSATTGLQALQNMAGLGGVSTKDMNAFLAEAAKAEQQAMLKQHQKLLQQLPASSQQRKAYEAMFAEMKHLSSYLSSSKLGSYPTHDAKVNKWLAEQSAALTEEALGMDYRSRSRSRQPSTPTMQDNVFTRKSLTGEESVPVINKITGKRLTGNKAPQLKRLTQWLTENPAYEIDPKWLEMTQNPQSPSPKPSPSEASTSSSSSSKAPHRSSANVASSSGSLGQSSSAANQYSHQSQSLPSTSKKSRSHDNSAALTNAAAAAAAMQFPGLAGLNPNLLSSLPGLGSFDPKNPLLMPFAGMPGLAGMSGLGNLNNMNLFANLAGLGLGNLAGLDPQSLAAMMAAAGGSLDAATAAVGGRGMGGKNTATSSSNTGTTSSKGRKSDNSMSSAQQQSSSQSSSAASTSKTSANSASSQSAANAAFPFLFPNPSLLYPLGLPYPLSPGMSPYDQLAQYSLLNGAGLGAVSSGASSSTTTSSPRQSSNKNSSNSGRGSASSQSSSASPSGKTRSSSMSSRMDTSQLQSLLNPHDPHLLESLSRVTGLDISQTSRALAGNPKAREATLAATKDAIEKLEKERRKLLESMSRGNIGSDLAAMQAFATGKLPSTSLTPTSSAGSSSSKGLLSKDTLPVPLPPDFSQTLFAEMAAAAGVSIGSSGGSSSSASKRSRDQELKDSFEHMSKSQMEMLARNLGMSSCISLIPTSSGSSSHHAEDKIPAKRSRSDHHHSSSGGYGSGHGSGHKIEEALPLVMEDKIHTRSSRCSDNSTTIEKVTMSPSVSGVSLSSLPSQTTITIAPSTSAHASPVAHHSSSASITAPAVSPATTTVTAIPENLTKPVHPAPVIQEPPPPPPPAVMASPPNTHEMDLEDLIAPSKVSKGGGGLMVDDPPPMPQDPEPKKVQEPQSGGESEDAPSVQHQEQQEAEKKQPVGKRTRGKRPRSGDDAEALNAAVQQPERKRELRSSAGRAAAAAAARIAAEAKAAAAAAAASNEESLNLSTSDESKT